MREGLAQWKRRRRKVLFERRQSANPRAGALTGKGRGRGKNEGPFESLRRGIGRGLFRRLRYRSPTEKKEEADAPTT